MARHLTLYRSPLVIGALFMLCAPALAGCGHGYSPSDRFVLGGDPRTSKPLRRPSGPTTEAPAIVDTCRFLRSIDPALDPSACADNVSWMLQQGRVSQALVSNCAWCVEVEIIPAECILCALTFAESPSAPQGGGA